MNAEAIKTLLIQTQTRMLELVDSLSDAQRDIPYHPGINPPVWEMGHAAFFFEWFILKERDGRPTFAPRLDDVWDSFQLAHQDRWSTNLFPDYRATRQYSQHVHAQILERLERLPLTPEDLYLYRYAAYHQNMHIESLIWARQTLGYAPPADSQWRSAPHAEADGCQPATTQTGRPSLPSGSTSLCDLASGDVLIPGGTYWIGVNPGAKNFATTRFAFDNEKPGHARQLRDFAISRCLVTCGEFLEFVKDRGYERPELWSRGGQRWLRQPRLEPGVGQARPVSPPRNPRYWRRQGNDWEIRFFDRWLPLNPQRPVTHVSFWEADAWCRWAGRRLPSEFEWEVAALGRRHADDDRLLPGYVSAQQPDAAPPVTGCAGQPDQAPHARGSAQVSSHSPPTRKAQVLPVADLDARYLAQASVAALSGTDSLFGCRQMLGTCWEWTASQFFPYDGFTMDMYPFMSTLQFGDHKTTRGGSCATSSCLIRGTYRQAYHPDRDDVFVGFRTCRNSGREERHTADRGNTDQHTVDRQKTDCQDDLTFKTNGRIP